MDETVKEETSYQPVEPTTPAPYPYGFMPIAPPPPPESLPQKKRRITWRHVSLLYVIIVLVLVGEGIAYVVLPSLQGRHNTSPLMLAPTFTAIIPTTTSQPTVNQNYAAVNIMSDFNAAGIHPKFVEYNRTIWSWTGDTYFVSVDATSSVDFTDDGGCTDHCSPADVGVWVYNSHDTAFQAYNDVLNDKSQVGSIPMMGTPNEVLHGRCLLLTTLVGSGSIYEQVVTQDCV